MHFKSIEETLYNRGQIIVVISNFLQPAVKVVAMRISKEGKALVLLYLKLKLFQVTKALRWRDVAPTHS
jgi:hypothetical protein